MSAAYTSTVVARGHVVAGALLGAAAVVATAVGWLRPWPLGVLVALVLVATGWWVGTVRLAVGAGELRAGLGPYGRGHRIPLGSIVSADAVTLSRRQVLGFGLPWRARTARLTVRRGPTLVVRCRDGAILRVSTADPGVAARLVANRPGDPGEERS